MPLTAPLAIKRCRAQFAALFEQAGLKLARVFPVVLGICVLEGVPA